MAEGALPGGGLLGRARSDDRKSEKKRSDGGAAAGAAMLLGLLAVASVVVIVLLLRPAADGEEFLSGTPALALLLLGGALVFLFGVASVVSTFKALKLTNASYPLGLPDGSVQAITALILIFLFFLMSVFLYTDITTTQQRGTVLPNLTQAQLDAMSPSRILSVLPLEVTGEKDARFDVVAIPPNERSQVADEVARQLITTIGTLIVAIAAFYFGAKSIGGGQNGQNGPQNGDFRQRQDGPDQSVAGAGD